MTTNQNENVPSMLSNLIDESDKAAANYRTQYNAILQKLELENELKWKEIDDKYSFLYPSLDDQNFNIKIANKKEFHDTKIDEYPKDIEIYQDKLCNTKFELAPHQLFLRNYLSFQTPYNSLLLFHGLGTGKTCSAITVCEEMRHYSKQIGSKKKIMIIASPNVQDNFRLQLFDERKLVQHNGRWTLSACTGNSYLNEINPMGLSGLSKDDIIKQVNRLITSSYTFMGYTEFSNVVSKILNYNKSDDEEENKKREAKRIESIKREFSDRLIVIDEIHNIRKNDDNTKKIVFNLQKLVQFTVNMKLLLLSATPMFNSYKEIIWLINLMNLNDNRSTIEISDVFNNDGTFKEYEDGQTGRNILIRKARGYISYVRGDNPYTFPFKIYPRDYDSPNSIFNYRYPIINMIDIPIEREPHILDIYVNRIGDYQNKGYKYILDKIKQQLVGEQGKKKFNYTILEPLIQSLNIVYPNDSLDVALLQGGDNDINLNYRDLIGKQGLETVMNFNTSSKKDFSYVKEPIFKGEEIGKYSSKMASIRENILKSEGIVMIYSQYIDGGCIPLALMLEEMGITRLNKHSLFSHPPTIPLDALTMRANKSTKTPAHYVMITGDKLISPNNLEEFKVASASSNKNGENVKIVIISRAGSEGLDFKNIRQIHILEPWYNMNRIEQTIGRGIRNCSHKDLPFDRRNSQVYMHGTLLDNADETVETADLYMYRIAEIKAKEIGHVTRVLKESSIDCLLRQPEKEMSEEDFNKKVKQVLSNGEGIDFNVGDKAYSSICDYMESCKYKCIPDMEKEMISYDTYNEDFIVNNAEQIINRIKDIMKDYYVVEKDILLKDISAFKTYPDSQVYAALELMTKDKSYIIQDRFNRNGNLVNIGNYFMFQPIELENERISTFERMVPLEYKLPSLKFDVENIEIDKHPMIDKKRLSDFHILSKTKANIDFQIEPLLKQIAKNYNIALTHPDVKISVEPTWYGSASISYQVLSQLLPDFSDHLYKIFIIDHNLDFLSIDSKLPLFKYIINSNIEKNDDFSMYIHNYFKQKLIRKGGLTGIIFINNNQQPVLFVNKDNGEWDIAEPVEKELFEDVLKPHSFDKAKVIGFLAFLNDIIFKTKDTEDNKRHRGARCDNAGKKNVEVILSDIKKLADIPYNEELETHKYSFKSKIMFQLCSEIELLLRYLDITKNKNKKWFFNYEDSIINKI